jgi:hypothetical protein
MDDGRWKMEDGRWKMEDGRQRITVFVFRYNQESQIESTIRC